MNPGCFISINVVDGRFIRLFVFYGTCVEGFRTACKPLIFLDGIFLKDRYKDIATAYDDNNKLFSLAFCVCDIEDERNWNWFL